MADEIMFESRWARHQMRLSGCAGRVGGWRGDCVFNRHFSGGGFASLVIAR